MPRVNGVMQLPPGSYGAPNTTIKSAPYNAVLDDFTNDANNARPITAGGTGASSAAGARTALGLAIGSDVQAYDALLQSIAGLTTVADRMIYTTGVDTAAVTTITSYGRSLIDDPDAATARATLGLGTIATQAASAVAITGGTIAGITDLAVADGGTGASTASAARTNLGAQAQSASLDSLSGLTTTANQIAYTTGSNTWAVTSLTTYGRSLIDDPDAATARGTLGLGTMATQNANAVAITGGSVAGITDLAVADGGTGASTAAGAKTNLGITDAVQAWVNFNGTGTLAVRASDNILGVTDNGVGQYAPVFSSAAPNANYAVVPTCRVPASTSLASAQCVPFSSYNGSAHIDVAPTTAGFSVKCLTQGTNNQVDCDYVMLAVLW